MARRVILSILGEFVAAVWELLNSTLVALIASVSWVLVALYLLTRGGWLVLLGLTSVGHSLIFLWSFVDGFRLHRKAVSTDG